MPEMIVGIAMTIVIDARYFIALFKRLSIREESSSRSLDNVPVDPRHFDRLLVFDHNVVQKILILRVFLDAAIAHQTIQYDLVGTQ